jgi:hypothetical protein
MTLYFDPISRRIVCRWSEPTAYVMSRRHVVINRSRSISAKLTKRGRISKTDLDRHKGHPMLRHILLLSRKLGLDALNGRHDIGPCRICGSTQDVNLHFDPQSGQFRSLCVTHRYTPSTAS